jgi:hypothetical protein
MLKGLYLVFVIEWQPRWTNVWLSDLHRRLVHKNTCVNNSCHQGEMAWICCIAHTYDDGAYCILTWYGVMWLRWRRSRQDLARRTGCKSEGQVMDLAPMDRGNDEEQVRSRLTNQYGHVMIWSGSYHLWLCWCMYCIDIEGDEMECARQMYNL